ncbi:MAG: Ig-like domain-containing protein, partial [Candidatus Krumholzibacteria bacterium]|nr:Ig-like domain-containing protein [Candidatus Krumholzibacteria bacterium]
SSSLGTITGSAMTDTDGKATATFTAGTTAGTATVTAFYGSLSPTDQIVLTSSTAAAIALEASETSLQVKETGGTELSTITATVRDALGNLVPAGIQVTFSVSPDGTFRSGDQDTSVVTNENGEASVVYQSGSTSGTKTFTVTSGSASASAPLIIVSSGPPVQIVIGSGANLSVENLGNGLARTKIGAFVSDTYSNPVSQGTEVFFELTGANADTADITTIVETDEFGVAEAKITYPTEAGGLDITIRVSSGTVFENKTITLPIPPSALQ